MSDEENEASAKDGASADESPSQPALAVPARRKRGRGPEVDEDPETARKRLLLVIPLVMAAAAIVALVLAGLQDKGMYSKPVDQLVAEKAKFVNRPVRAEGMLVHGSLEKKVDPCEFRFRLEKNGVQVPVSYKGCIVPDTFKDVPDVDVGVTVEGQLLTDTSLEASSVLAKCPSKYDMDTKAANGEKAPHVPKAITN